jgi:transposase
MSFMAQGIAEKSKRKFKDPLRIIDASIISLCLSRFDWAKYRKSKGALKLHLCLDGDKRIPFEAYITEGKVRESTEMKNLCNDGDVIYVMDKGYMDYKSLYDIEMLGSKFVTRLKSNSAYECVYDKALVEKDGGVLSDTLIKLTGAKTKNSYPKSLRVVKYEDKETGKIYEFLTNDMRRSASEIAFIYKERREVELFHKRI